MIIFITGISGAGKNTALRILEDNGFYCIDNAPLNLIPKIIYLSKSSNIENIAFTIDPRMLLFSKKNTKDQLINSINKFSQKIINLSKKYNTKIIFLDSDNKVLIKRFNVSRRIHPLNSENIEEGINLEKELLSKLKDNSHYIIDTSLLSPYDLSLKILEIISSKVIYTIKLTSFGVKYGFLNADYIIDTRVLNNPFYISNLAFKTGLDEEVKKYLLSDPKTVTFLEKTENYLEYIINLYLGNVKNFIEIGISCTGGKHRSVFTCEYLSQKLREKYKNYRIIVEHRDIYKEN